jgi:glucose-1-phosphate thymidylyltransferase
MKGIILAGGSGTRLYPLTLAISKQLLPVYDKPMVYYPLSLIMLASIREVLIISTPHDLPQFRELLGDGSHLGLSLTYQVQEQPDGLAQAFIIGREFLAGGPACLVLGDNIMYGDGLIEVLGKGATRTEGGFVFGYRVTDPQRYGVVEFDAKGKAISLEEKPLLPKSNYAVPGVYFYGADVCDVAASLKPSVRGELEITDLNRVYLERGTLEVEKLGRGIAWFDTGTHRSLLDAANFIAVIEERQGLRIACPEEIAWLKGWISDSTLADISRRMGKSAYAEYLSNLLANSK